MRVAFRADASIQIGTGHVMRCLTLADALTEKRAECQFICREHPGNLISYIREKGYVVHTLPVSTVSENHDCALAHAAWLGSSQREDAEQCAPLLEQIHPDWFILDHYALGHQWESALRPYGKKLMVIDDLADRQHDCDLLLDQTYGRAATDYRPLVPKTCRLLCGSQYALLRPEFARWRSYSLARRKVPVLKHLLINLGGVDKDNVTSKVLQALNQCILPADCDITVVMGTTAPWIEEVRTLALTLPWSTSVLVGVGNMAQLMADSDLAIGAAGATSWERCCLGLPTLMLVLAENQRAGAQALNQAQAAKLLDPIQDLDRQLPLTMAELNPAQLVRMSHAAAAITDGQGACHVLRTMGVTND